MQRATLVLTSVVLVVLGLVLWQQHMNPSPTLLEITSALHSDRVNLSIENTVGVEMTTITTTWKSSSGSHSVTTTRQENESVEDWVDRHAHEVQAAQQQFPPI